MENATAYVNVRLMKEVDAMLRRGRSGAAKRGVMSRRIISALTCVDLAAIPLVEARTTERCGMTQVALPSFVYAHSKSLAERRECSFNRLLNSALQVHLARSG